MKRLWIFAFAAILCWNFQPAQAQGLVYKITHPDAVGGGFVATHIDGAGKSTAFGPGFEVFAKYNMRMPGLYAMVGTGFYRATDAMIGYDFYWRNLFPTVEAKVGYNIIPKERFSPFLFVGAQGYMFNSNIDSKLYGDATIFGGGGFQYELNPKMSIHFTGDYRYALTDPNEAKYWVAKAGISYALNPKPRQRETMEYPMDESDLALEALFKDTANDQPTRTRDEKPTEEDALALLFQGDEASGAEIDTGLPTTNLAYDTPTTNDPLMNEAAEIPSTEAGRLLAKINELRNEMEVKDREISDLRSKVNAHEQALVQFSRGVAGQMTGYGDDALAELDMQNFKASYESALKKHYAKDFNGAIRMFKALLSAQPDHRLASNCQYWIGESYNAMGQYSDAIQAFNQVLRYQSSFKLDDALIMAGIVYLKLGNEASAREQFQKLVSNFPDSEYAPKAMRYLGRM